jgi:hypothetical protein
VANGEHRRNRPVALIRHPNLEVSSEAIPQIDKPFPGLWRPLVPLSGKRMKPVEVVEEFLGGSFAIAQTFAFGPQNLPLRRVLVTVAEQRVDVWPQVKLMKRVGYSRVLQRSAEVERLQRAHLDVTPLSAPKFLLQRNRKALRILLGIHQRLAVIREWQRYQASPS